MPAAGKIKVMEPTFTDRVKQVLKSIPYGKVTTYGQVAMRAGNYRAARQVVRVLHTSSKKEKLPWHRVINRQGKISLKPGAGFEEQARLLSKEGIPVSETGQVDLDTFLWCGDPDPFAE